MRLTAALSACCLLPFSAHATLGLFEHGVGIKSLGYGGVSYVGIEETTALSANPAFAIGLGSRFDLGADLLTVRGGTQISGNPLGPDEYYDSNGKRLFPIPQVGVSFPIAERWAAGIAAFAAGLGPDYPQSPYARFAAPGQEAASASALNTLKIAGISLVLAHEVVPGQSIGLSVNLQHQSLSTEGTVPFGALSEAPEFVGNQGQHGAFGVSATVGWTGKITDWLSGGLSYRSKAFTQRIEQYRGLLPDQGRLELPAIYGGALQATLTPTLQIAVEAQRYAYSESNGFGNRIDLLSEGRLLGSTDGPGFGWRDQNAYKIGLRWQPRPEVILRSGFSYATQVIPRSQTLFNGLAPATPQLHFTLGMTYALSTVDELTGFASTTEQHTVHGENSIPLAFGGGEADVRFMAVSFGLSYGRRFGKTP